MNRNRPSLEVALMAIWMLQDALTTLRSEAKPGPCRCKEIDPHGGHFCEGCDELHLAEDATGLLHTVTIFEAVLDSHTFPMPEAVRDFRQFLRDYPADWPAPVALAEALLTMAGAVPDESDVAVPAIVAAAS